MEGVEKYRNICAELGLVLKYTQSWRARESKSLKKVLRGALLNNETESEIWVGLAQLGSIMNHEFFNTIASRLVKGVKNKKYIYCFVSIF